MTLLVTLKRGRGADTAVRTKDSSDEPPGAPTAIHIDEGRPGLFTLHLPPLKDGLPTFSVLDDAARTRINVGIF